MRRFAALGPFLLWGATVLAGTARCGAQEGIGISDNRGYFYSVTQRYGQNAFFQVTKLSLTGQVQWNVAYDPRADVTPAAIALDPDGNVIVTGSARDANRQGILIVKFTSAGAVSWSQKRSAPGAAIPTLISTDADGNIYVAATVSEPSGAFLRVTRLNSGGSVYWEQPYRGARTNYARSMVINRNGDAHITVESYYGDRSEDTIGTDPRYQNSSVRQVIFTVNGGVVPQ